jgi:hypothetical protein
MADLFSTNVLNRVVANLKGNPQFLLERYFPQTQTEQSEEIHFDVMDGKRRISPFVSPLVEGQIVASPGYRTGTFKPAYIKDKRVFDMNRPLKRSAGEPLGGNLAPMDRLRAMIARDTQDQLDMLARRLEVMAGEVMATGKIVVVGDKYPATLVDFGRNPANTIVANPLWSAAGAKPLDDLALWSMSNLQTNGVALNDVVMTADVWPYFRENTQVHDRLDMYRTVGGPPSVQPGVPVTEGGTYMGAIDNFNLYVYSGWYVDPMDGIEKPILPAGTVLLTSPQMDGVRAYGAIRDEEAGLQATPYFMKSWVEQDPSVRFIMMQSAPLLVPYRPDLVVKAKVL